MTSPYSEFIRYTTHDWREAMECMRCQGPEEIILVQKDPDIIASLADYLAAADQHNAQYHPTLAQES